MPKSLKLLLLILYFFLQACNKPLSTPTGSINFDKLTPSCYVASSTNPIISSGDFSSALSLGTTTWNDPHVIKVGSEYWMYASSDDNFNHDIKIYRLTSTDGINWTPNPTTPVLERSTGQWDSQSTETPAVVFFKNQYHLFWTGYDDYTNSKTFKIGHATSTDGVNFIKDSSYLLAPTNPNGVSSFEFNQFVVAEPAPVVFNDKIYLYFAALGANFAAGSTLQVVGLVTSSDGTTWSSPVSILEPDQNQYPRSAPQYYLGFSTPHAIVMNDQMHLYMDVVQTNDAGTAFNQLKLHHAVSSDGETTWTHDSQEIFDRTAFSWTASEIRSPSLYLEGSTLLMWFAGHTGITLGIGRSTCDLSR